MGKALEALTLIELLEAPNKAGVVRDRFGIIFTDEDSPETIVAKFLVANDVVQVVRCKDCKYRTSSEFCECRPDDAFCSEGKRRDDHG